LVRAKLVVDMDRTIKPGDRMHGAKWAAKQLVRDEHWCLLIEGRNDGEEAAALLKQYQTSKHNPQVMETVRAYRGMDAAQAAEWQRQASAVTDAEAKKLG
jgi:hypothetical protein